MMSYDSQNAEEYLRENGPEPKLTLHELADGILVDFGRAHPASELFESQVAEIERRIMRLESAMTDAGEKLALRVKRMIGEGMFTADMIRAELELAAVEAEEKIRIYEREHGYCECAICNTAREIVAIIRRRKE